MASIESLVSFDGTNGDRPQADLIVDEAGNIYGTTSGGTAASSFYGTVFVIGKTAAGYDATPTTIASFNRTDGDTPVGTLVRDSSGNLFGTTSFGGNSGDGTVYEILGTSAGYSSTPTTLVSFDRTDGNDPVGGLIADKNGNLLGTTSNDGTLDGGDLGFGTLFEVRKTATGFSNTPTNIVNFGFQNGAQPYAPLVQDASGNLFGTTNYGGNQNYGTVFEVAANAGGYSGAMTLGTFGGDGAAQIGRLVLDSSGNIYGTSSAGGSTDNGLVFEIPKTATGYGSKITVAEFNGTDGSAPINLIMDGAGNLFGTTYYGGTAGDGAVFEIARSASGYSSTPTTLVSFDGTNGMNPSAGLVSDAQGDLFGTTEFGGSSSLGTVFEVSDSGFVMCFCSGTLIETSRGAVAIEDLKVGDRVVTISGTIRPVTWTGCRIYSMDAPPKTGVEYLNADVCPVRIRANAFGYERPSRDLFLSPGHPVLVGEGAEEVLVPIMCLVNGTSIARMPSEAVTYWHVELDEHDILLAEGLAAESFLDLGNRAWFSNDQDCVLTNPDFVPAGLSGRCRPVATNGPVVERERRRIDALFETNLTSACCWPRNDESIAAY